MKHIPLDKDNRMLRAGFGKNEGNWFLRIDLWWFGIRFSEEKPRLPKMENITLSRRNLTTLLSKLDRKREGEFSACTLIKRDTQLQTMPVIAVMAVEDEEVYTDRQAGEVHPSDTPTKL